ncbi:MAG: hypothetical protein IPL84_16420 [Chitinophagaceae bacterium]|nr:hypothetical protein [Chitinophagaceae bacterium]
MAKEKRRRIIFVLGLTACFSFYMPIVFGQTVQTFTDRKDILIGEQIRLKLKVNLPLQSETLTKWITIPESIPHFDMVEAGKPDTIRFKDDSKAIEQTIVFTSFDSGRWVFPALPVEFGSNGQSPQILRTDSFYVNVSYSPADSSNQLRDIKPIIKVSVNSYFWYYIAGAVLLLLIFGFLLYRYFKKKKQVPPVTADSSLSPFDEAMAALKSLEQLNLQEEVEIKNYHIRLAGIFKIYMGRKQNKNLLNKTTGDILITLKDVPLPAEQLSVLATALRCTDAVKFAKYLPLPPESKDCRKQVQDVIGDIETIKRLNN